MNRSWYSKKILSFFIVSIITVIMIFSAIQIELGENKDSKYTVFSVIFEYYGMDAELIEDLITIPLEEKIMPTSGLLELRSSIEYNKSTTTAYFKKDADSKKIYLTIRNIVDSLYKTLPSDVQKPRIISSAADEKAVLSIAFTGSANNINTRNWIENNLKKDLEAIDGVSEVVIAGGNIEEILIAFDVDKINALGQSPGQLSTVVRDGNSLNPGSIIKHPGKDEKVSFDTKLHTLDEIRQLPLKIGDRYSTLGYFADIAKRPRENDEIVRINGEECVTVGLKSSSNGNNIFISEECRRILEEKNFPENSWNILYDSGEDLHKIINQVFIAMIGSLIGICLLIPFFYNKVRVFILAIGFLFISSIWTIGLLRLFGFSLNQNTLSGITIAFGLIADAMFIINETAFSATSLESYYSQVKKLIPSIVSASFTTIMVLIPLFFMDNLVPGTRTITVTIGIMLVVSVVITVIFYPCFVDSSIKDSASIIPIGLYKNVNRMYLRNTFRGALFCEKHFRISLLVYGIMLIIPVLSFFILGKDLTLNTKTDIIYATIEFEPEYHAEYVDRTIAPFIEKISSFEEITFVRSEAKKGTAEVEIGFDEKKTDKKTLASKISSYEELVSSGFLYMPGLSGKNKESKSIEIAVIGDDVKQCMNYVNRTTEILSKTGLYNSIVKNFKRPEQIITFKPYKDLLQNIGLTVDGVASELRWVLFGPVADKWLEDGVESDIRIRGKNFQNANQTDIKNVYIPTETSSVRLDTLGQIKAAEGQSKIYRKDGRRAAYFTIEADYGSMDRISKDLHNILGKISLEKGYGYSFPREIELMSEQYWFLTILLILSIIGIIILLTTLTEKIKQSLVISSIIPVSLCFPMIICMIAGRALEFGDIIGMVILAGISVNNSIYITESNMSSCIFKLRNKISSILITSLTSIVGAIPLLIFTKDPFSRSMSFFMIWGILNSLIVSSSIFPVILKKYCFNSDKKNMHV